MYIKNLGPLAFMNKSDKVMKRKAFEMYIKNLGPLENAVQELAEGFLPVKRLLFPNSYSLSIRKWDDPKLLKKSK